MAKKLNVALVTFPYSYAVPTGLADFITTVLAPLCHKLVLITGQLLKVKGKNIQITRMACQFREGESLLLRIGKVIIPQFSISVNLLRLCRKYKVIIFFCTAELFLLPMLISWLMRKRIIIIHTGNLSLSYGQLYHQGMKRIIPLGLRLLEKIAFSLAQQIVLQSEEVIALLKLERYHRKISLTHYYSIGNQFKPKTDLAQRANLVGYIGKFAFFKGAVNFAQAIPLVLARRRDVRFLMAGGSGSHFQRVEAELKQNGTLPHVNLYQSVPPGKVARYLNQLKLLVLPSYSEGVPKIILEAMSCGTPVLATAVGGITGIIEDKETGFLLKDNSPQSIAEGIIQALEHPQLTNISNNARKRIEENYNINTITRNWQTVLYS
ncbi:MAG: glycosyltransferase [Dehalococcoidales bacterium]|nr:glycosyltransferase [Dehalococcoidales bacterium]